MYNALRCILQPYPLLLIGLAYLLVVAWRRRFAGVWWLSSASISLGIVWLLSSPLVAHFMLASLEGTFRPLRHWPAECHTIVVLGGNLYNAPEESLAARLSESSSLRCLEAARLYNNCDQPRVVVSGGKILAERQSPSVALAMRDYLIKLGVDDSDVLMEEISRTTYENSVETRRLLSELNVDNIVLVTDAAHMKRARRCFSTSGFKVTPGCCHFRASGWPPVWSWGIPSPTELVRTHDAMHEWFGMLWYQITGKI